MLPPRAYTFIGLNIVRALNVIALLLVFASSVVILVNDVKSVNRFVEEGNQANAAGNSTATVTTTDYIHGSTVPNQPAGAFWAVLNRLLIIAQVIVLILSELGWPSSFFTRFFPVLGKDFGTGALGIIECLIAAAILSHFVDTFALVSAFFLFAIGCLSMLVGLIFRGSAKTKRSLTSFRDAAKNDPKSLLPTHVAGVDIRPIIPSQPPAFVSTFFTGEKAKSEAASADSINSNTGLGFGRRAEKAAGLKGFLISKPLESLPRYAASRNGAPGGN